MKRSRHLVTIIVAAAVIVLAVVLVRHPRALHESREPVPRFARVPPPARERPPARGPARIVTETDAGKETGGRAAPAEAPPLPHSLAGTDVDGWLGVDDTGRLVVTPGARWFFEYFLSAQGEQAPESIRARIIAEIEKRLSPSGAAEAIDLLDRYLAYRERVRQLTESGAPGDLPARLDRVSRIRRETFGEDDAAALFGEEEALQRIDVERRQVLDDETLSSEERQRRLDDLEQELPESVRAARAAAMAPLRLAEDEARLRAEGAESDEIRALRESRFGPEAAARLEALDRERAEWQRRVDEYRAARDDIEARPGLAEEQRAEAIAALRGELFTPDEQPRVEALDKIEPAR